MELGGHTGFQWWYKKSSPTPAGSCTWANVFPTLYPKNLSAGTSYTYKAYSDSGCTTEIGSTTFTTKLAKPTLGTSVLTNVTYTGDARTPPAGTGAWYERYAFSSSTNLRASLNPGTVSYGAGTTLEVGWYSETAPTTRVGTASVNSGIYALTYVSAPAGRYRALAYCTKGSGSNKVYSAPVNLMRGGSVAILGTPSSARSAPTDVSATAGTNGLDYWAVLHWTPVAEATHHEYRYKPTGEAWTTWRNRRWRSVLTQAHDSACTWPCRCVRSLAPRRGDTFQVRALKAGRRTWVWISPASTEFSTTTVARGASDPVANLPAEVTLSTSPTTVPEGTAVTVTATLSRSLSAAVTIPLTVTSGTSDDGDHGTLSGITINDGSLSGSGTITTTSDGDGDDEPSRWR